MKYLGLALASTIKSGAIWNNALVKLERKFATGKRIYLFKGDSITLIKYYILLTDLFPLSFSFAYWNCS